MGIQETERVVKAIQDGLPSFSLTGTVLGATGLNFWLAWAGDLTVMHDMHMEITGGNVRLVIENIPQRDSWWIRIYTEDGSCSIGAHKNIINAWCLALLGM